MHLISSSYRIFIVSLLVTLNFYSIEAFAQLYGPNRNWSAATQYIASDKQDSVFVFFQANQATLRAQFSDSSASNYTWFKYNQNLPYSSRYQELVGVSDSILTGVERGGYRVNIYNPLLDSTESYVAWLMVDNVTLNSLDLVSNSCERLDLMLYTTPNFFDVNSLFAYNDISIATHQERNVLATGGYFANHSFQSLNSQVSVNQTQFSLPFIFIEFENTLNGKFHGPLHDAAYRFTVQTPFGRGSMVIQTQTIQAVATKSEFDILFWDDEIMDFGQPQTDQFPSGEALLEMKLTSKAINADSIYWNILNDKLRLAQGGDSIIWADSSLFSERVWSTPDKNLMIPGFYNIEHVSSKVTSNRLCRDTLIRTVDVDTSFVRNVPNVFTPGGSNPYFRISDDDLRSIKTFKIVIFSRSGQQVYRYVGDKPKEWEGWNGKIDGTKGDAPSGVYYYVIDAVGWDGVRYRNGQYKGFLHLYR
jgi:hypothetical protein